MPSRRRLPIASRTSSQPTRDSPTLDGSVSFGLCNDHKRRPTPTSKNAIGKCTRIGCSSQTLGIKSFPYNTQHHTGGFARPHQELRGLHGVLEFGGIGSLVFISLSNRSGGSTRSTVESPWTPLYQPSRIPCVSRRLVIFRMSSVVILML